MGIPQTRCPYFLNAVRVLLIHVFSPHQSDCMAVGAELREVETLGLLRSAFGVWSTDQLVGHMVPSDQPQTQWMMVAVMLLGLFTNATVPQASVASTGWPFVVPLLLIQLGRTLWTLANAPDAVFRDHYFRTRPRVKTGPSRAAGALSVSSVSGFHWYTKGMN